MHPIRESRIARKFAFAIKSFLRSFSKSVPLNVIGSGPDRIEAVYVINLDRQPARWESVKVEACRQVVEGNGRLLEYCHRVSAVDGKLLDANIARGLVNPTYPLDAQYYVDPDPRLLDIIRVKDVDVTMSREEIAVALSHIKAWRQIVAEDRSHALILEDDVFFEDTFADQLNRTWHELPESDAHAPAFDLLYISFREVEQGAQTISWSANLVRPLKGYWWLSGYVLSNMGARKLLASLPITGPVDLWMNHRFADLAVFSSPASLVSQRTDFLSDNSYSILPLLTQLGVQMDKAHMVLEQTRGQRPVFCIGFGRKGAATLESALSLLSYRCCHDRWGQHSKNLTRLLDENVPLLFDAYIRVGSIAKQVDKICHLYPEAVFILPPAVEEDGDISSEEYASTTRVLREQKMQFLTFDALTSPGWGQLCEFLRCEKPEYPYPACAWSDHVLDLPGQIVKRTAISSRKIIIQQHDVHPWIVPYQRMAAFGLTHEPRQYGAQVGTFESLASERISLLDESRWIALADSFPSNLAQFRRENIEIQTPNGCRLILNANAAGDRKYSASSLRSKQDYRYGRFEAVIKPARTPGVVTAFFLHRNDPWQEIDIEFVGSDTKKLLVNVYFNPGTPGARCNYGNRGTPFLIDLGFDAADDFHRYTVEWEPHEIRWFVDDDLIHVRATWEPTPVPNLPMHVFVSIWPPRSSELAGILSDSELPTSSDIKNVTAGEWHVETSDGRRGQFVRSVADEEARLEPSV